MQEVFYCSSQSDGYVTTYFFESESLRDLYYELDEEGCGATDSEGSFKCQGGFDSFSGFEVIANYIIYSDDLAERLNLASEMLSDSEYKELTSCITSLKEQ